MFVSRKIITATALLSFSSLSFADFYAGAGGVMSEYQYDDVSHGFGAGAFAGYRMDSNFFPLMFELGYLSSGKSKINNYAAQGYSLTNASLSFNGALASVGYFGQFSSKGSGGFGKLGYYSGKSKFEGTFTGPGGSGVLNTSETSSGLMFSLGIDWMFTQLVGLHFEIGSLQKVKDLPQLDPSHKSNVTFANLGVVFSFGRSEKVVPVAMSTAPEPALAVVEAPAFGEPDAALTTTTPTAPSAQEPHMTAPVTAAAQPTRTSGTQAIPGTIIRDQPTEHGPISAILKNGGTVTLVSRVVNSTGAWWYLRAGNTDGWVKEEELRLATH